MEVCFVGGYDSDYPRNSVLRRGLSLAGVAVSECHVRPGYKFWLRYPRLAAAWLTRGPRRDGGRGRDNRPGYIFVPEFCQKDVPLARSLAVLGSRPGHFRPAGLAL